MCDIVKFKKINREIKILTCLAGKHNVISLLDIVKEGGVYCLVFEYVCQTDYRKLLEILSPPDCKFYLYQILKGLHYAHSMGIMHRDIKPQNIMIDHDLKKVAFTGCRCESSTGGWESFICQRRTTTCELALDISKVPNC